MDIRRFAMERFRTNAGVQSDKMVRIDMGDINIERNKTHAATYIRNPKSTVSTTHLPPPVLSFDSVCGLCVVSVNISPL